MDVLKTEKRIVEWLQQKAADAGCEGYVIGVSGGIDSALTSTLCALTSLKVYAVTLPIHQPESHVSRANNHIEWLQEWHPDVQKLTVDLTGVYECYKNLDVEQSDLALVNSRSRLRMAMLYSIANTHNLLVAGTGNKVEDYGIGFFTKYGDGGVDVSPIADLLKSEVRTLSLRVGISSEIIEATPTDGLWEDDRSDEDQIGASYEELEWALSHYDENGNSEENLDDRQIEVLKIYAQRHIMSRHKLEAPPVCLLGENK